MKIPNIADSFIHVCIVALFAITYTCAWGNLCDTLSVSASRSIVHIYCIPTQDARLDARLIKGSLVLYVLVNSLRGIFQRDRNTSQTKYGRSFRSTLALGRSGGYVFIEFRLMHACKPAERAAIPRARVPS